jgi:hypothetical protein
VSAIGLPCTVLLLPTYSQNRADGVGSTAKSSTYLFSFILASVSLASGGATQARATRRRGPVRRECSTRPTGIGRIDDFEEEVIVGKLFEVCLPR